MTTPKPGFPDRPSRVRPANIVRLPTPPLFPPPSKLIHAATSSSDPALPWRVRLPPAKAVGAHVISGATSSLRPRPRSVGAVSSVIAHVVTPRGSIGADVVTPAVPSQAARLKRESLVSTLLKKLDKPRPSSSPSCVVSDEPGVYVDITHDDEFELEVEDELCEEEELIVEDHEGPEDDDVYEEHIEEAYDGQEDAGVYEEHVYEGDDGQEDAGVYEEHVYEGDDGHEDADTYEEHTYEEYDGHEDADMYEEHTYEEYDRQEVDMIEEHAYEDDDGRQETQVQLKRKLPCDWQWADAQSWGGSNEDVFRRGPAIPTNTVQSAGQVKRHRGTKHRGGARDQAARCDKAASAEFAEIMVRFHAGQFVSPEEYETMRWVYGRAKLNEMMKFRND